MVKAVQTAETAAARDDSDAALNDRQETT